MPKSLPSLLLLMALFLPSKTFSQTTKAPIPPPTNVCIPVHQARLITADLQKLPLVVKENKRLRTAVRGYEYVVRKDSVALAAKDTVIAATERRLAVSQEFEKDARRSATIYHAKAKKRSWVIVALSAVLAAVTYTAIVR